MVFGPITSWQIDGKTMETVTDFIFLGSKITADSDCSHEIKRCFLLGRKVMTNLDSILKSRNITLPTKVHLVKAVVFPVVMYACEIWNIKKAEHQRRCFWTVVLEKTLESPLDCKEIKLVNPKGNQSWIFLGRTDAEAEAPILLATWCEEPTHWERSQSWERLKAGGKGDSRGWDDWCYHWLDGHEFEQAPFLAECVWVFLYSLQHRRAVLLVPNSISARVVLYLVVVLMCSWWRG